MAAKRTGWKVDPNGNWFQCPRDGCGFCYQDWPTMTSDARHWGKYHPGYTEKPKEIQASLQLIPAAEGKLWKQAHPECYRWNSALFKASFTPGQNAKPRKPKLSTGSVEDVAPGRPATAPALHTENSSTTIVAADAMDLDAPSDQPLNFTNSDPDAMDLDSPGATTEPTASSLLPTPQYVYKWKCYVCNTLFTTRTSVHTHFLRQHLSTHYLFQPSRVPKVALDKDTGKIVKLVADNRTLPERSFMGIPVELRQLIFEQLLSVSQHPDCANGAFFVHALQLCSSLTREAKTVLEYSNLLIRLSVYHDGSGFMSPFGDILPPRTIAVLEPAIVDDLEVVSALHLTVDDHSAAKGPKTATTFVFAYNEAVFSELIRSILKNGTIVGALSINFRGLFHMPRHRHVAVDIIRFLGYLRFIANPCTAVSDSEGVIDTKSLKKQIDTEYSYPEGLAALLKLIIADAKDLLLAKKFCRALSLLDLVHYLCGDNACSYLDDPKPFWRNALDELYCNANLAIVQVINTMALEAIQAGNLATFSREHLYDAALISSQNATRFSVIRDPFRAQVHLARGIALKHFAMYLKLRAEIGHGHGHGEHVTWHRGNAQQNFFLATVLLEAGNDLDAAQRELAQMDYDDRTTTTAVSAGLVRWKIGKGLDFVCDKALLEQWSSVELDNIIGRRDRPDGWE